MQSVSTSEIWDDLKPRIDSLIATRITSSGVRSAGAAGGAVSAHALSGALHTGLLDDGQAPQFLLRSGARSLTGDLAVDSGIMVDGVDISAHAANPDAHHATATAGDGISLSGQQISIASSAAGAGLTYSSGVLAVGAGYGLAVNANDVQIAATAAGAGLTYSSGVLAVGAGYGLAVNANDVQIAATAAGAGLTYTLGVLAVGAGLGLTVNADDVALTTPGTLTVATSNASTGSHTHAVTSSSSPGAAASLLASSALGALTLPLLTATTSLTTPLIDADVNLELAPNTDILLNPVGDVVLGDGLTFRTNSFSTLFPIEGAIMAETAVEGQYGLSIGVIEADELRVRVFVADEVRIDRGEEIWGKSYGIVAEDFTTPGSIGGTVTVTFESSPMVSGALFASGDWLLFRTIDIDTGVVLSAVWGQVSDYVASNIVQFWNDFLPDSAMPLNSFPKVDLGTTTQDWTFTLRSGDTNYRIAEGNLGIDYGAAGQSYIAFSVTDPVAAPYIRIRRWTGANPYTPANHDDTVYIGNLNGIADASGDRGIWTQNEAGTSWAELSDDGVILRNASIALYDGATQKVNIGSSGTDFWMGVSSGDKRLYWNGTTLEIKGQIAIGSTGYTNLTDKPDSLADINASERYDLQTSASVVFTETFDNADSLTQWTNQVTGKGELSIVNLSDSIAGGYVLRVGNNSGDDQCWLFGNRKIPFDSGKTYRMRVRVRRVNGTATLYLGCAGVAANGVDWVNRNGSNSIATQHYHTAGNVTPGASWTEYVGYIRGYGATVGSGAVGTPNSPGEMHPNVRYIVPIILVNGAVAGQYEFDMVTIEAVTGVWYSIDGMPNRFGDTPGAAGLYLTADNMGYWNGSAWKAWIASTGEFYFGGSTGAHLEWNGTKLRGINSSSVEQWYADSTTGKLYAGAGAVILDSVGMTAGNTIIDGNGIRFDNDYTGGTYDLSWEYGGTNHGYIRGSYDLSDWLGLEIYSDNNISITGLIDVDGALGLKAVSAPSNYSSGGVLYVDTSDGDLKIKFANGTVKTIATN